MPFEYILRLKTDIIGLRVYGKDAFVKFSVPQGTTIKNGEFIVTDCSTTQRFSVLQILLGLKYRFGKNRMQWIVSSRRHLEQNQFPELFSNRKS